MAIGGKHQYLVRTRNGAQAQQHMLRGAMLGRALRINPDPPSIVSRPWNRAVVRLQGSGSGKVSVDMIETVLKNQLGFSDLLTNLELRIFTVHSWVTSELPGALEMIVYDFTRYNADGDDPAELCRVLDNSGRNHFAAVGYSWPISCQSLAPYSNGTTVYALQGLADDTETVDYVSVQWRATTLPTKLKQRSLHGL